MERGPARASESFGLRVLWDELWNAAATTSVYTKTTRHLEGPSGGRPDVNGGQSSLMVSVQSGLDVAGVKHPKERPPISRGSVDPYAAWAKEFVDYSKTHSFDPVLRNRIELDESGPYNKDKARGVVRNNPISELNFTLAI